MGENANVTDTAGSRGRLLTDMPAGARIGTIAIALDDGRHVVVPHEHVLTGDDGNYRLDARFDDFEIIEDNVPPTPDDDSRAIPIAREELSVGRRMRQTGKVRIDKHVEAEEIMVDEQVEFDEAEVERVAVGRIVDDDEVPQVRQEGDTLVIPVLEERLFKQVVLVEEIRVHRRRRTENVSEPVTLRREHVEISHDRLSPDQLSPDRLDSDAEPDEPRPSR